jgi:hypothetical protein
MTPYKPGMIDTTRARPVELFRSLGLLILAVTAAAIALWTLRSDPETRASQLAWVDTWTYQLQRLAAWLLLTARCW